MPGYEQDQPGKISRRAFAGLGLAAAAGLAQTPGNRQKTPIKLGIDNFAVRAFGWKAEKLIEYADELKTDSLFISDLDALGSLEPSHLERVRSQAKEKDIQLHLGTWSICPTSTTFRKTWGSAEEHLAVGLRSAAALGSPVLRVILGNGADRATPGGIKARIDDTVAVCRSQKALAQKLGVKIAVENHAGDMQARELAELVEKAGSDFVGVNLDSGNSAWTLEDPMVSLELLGRFALTTSLRDSMIWVSKDGATVQWTAMGDGLVDWPAYFKRFAELCPGIPVHIETISGFNRDIPYLKQDFWKQYPSALASDLAAFEALARKGKPRPTFNPPAGKDRKIAEQEYQRAEIEKSIAYCKQIGLGVRK